MKFDTTLNIESVVAALGVLGAAIGYLIDLVRRWIDNSKEKKYRGTNSIILDLLEQNFYSGLSEDELWKQYQGTETVEKRKTFGAYNPKRLGKLGFEHQLKHLQGRFLIRLTGECHYHIEFQEPYRWRETQYKGVYKAILAKVAQRLETTSLADILNSVLTESDANRYSRASLHHFLASEGDERNIDQLVNDLRGNDIDRRKIAIDTLTEIYRDSKY